MHLISYLYVSESENYYLFLRKSSQSYNILIYFSVITKNKCSKALSLLIQFSINIIRINAFLISLQPRMEIILLLEVIKHRRDIFKYLFFIRIQVMFQLFSIQL